MLRKIAWDDKENTLRGSFINLSITTLYMILIILGSIFTAVASNLKEMETLLIGIFVSSFGLWTGKKSVEFIKKFGLENVLSKSGLSLDDLDEAGETLRTKRMNGTSIKVESNNKNGEGIDKDGRGGN